MISKGFNKKYILVKQLFMHIMYYKSYFIVKYSPSVFEQKVELEDTMLYFFEKRSNDVCRNDFLKVILY